MQSDHLKNAFKNSNIILAQKQPKNLLRLLSKARFNTDINNVIQLKALFKCTDKRWTICVLYVNKGNSFNNLRWELRSHVTSNDINVIYYSKCVYWKNGWQYVVGFKSRINQRISDCRTGISTGKFPIHGN